MIKGAQTVPRKGLFGVLLDVIIKAAVHLAYIAGLTILIPLFLLLISPPPDVAAIEFLGVYFLVALALIVASVLALLWWKASLAKTLKTLGSMTLIPGILALVFAINGREIVLAWFETRILNFALVKPYFIQYLEQAVPKIWWLTVLYLLLGMFLILWGVRAGKEEYKGRWYLRWFRRR